jgi:hypothetical protein
MIGGNPARGRSPGAEPPSHGPSLGPTDSGRVSRRPPTASETAGRPAAPLPRAWLGQVSLSLSRTRRLPVTTHTEADATTRRLLPRDCTLALGGCQCHCGTQAGSGGVVTGVSG